METDDSIRSENKFKRIFFAPLIGINRLTGWFLAQIFVDSKQEAEEEILDLVDAGSEKGFIEDTSVEIINNAFEFDDLEISDVMTHRVDVVGISADTALDDIIYVALDKGFSRLPVYDGSLDNIIGIIIVKDLLSLVGEADLSEFSLNSFLRDAVCIPESGSCTGVFKLLKEKKAGMAIVIDEYGGTAGIVTMEDLIEKIMGNIQDEYDEDVPAIKQIGEDKYSVDGKTNPEDVLELFGYELRENHEYETLSGFVTDLLGYIPEQSETDDKHTPHVDYEDVRFVVTGVDDNCISKIIVYRTNQSGKEAIKDEKKTKEKA